MHFTNSAKGSFNRIPVDPKTGQKTGEAEVLLDGLAAPDDLEVDDKVEVAYGCNGALDQVLRVPLDGSTVEVAAELPGPTSVSWAEYDGQKVLYASTIGGFLQSSTTSLSAVLSIV